jgi:hypothetical protein
MRDWDWRDPSGGPRVWQMQLDELRSEILGFVLGLGDVQVNWQPVPGAWSIGRCIDHLTTTNAAILPRLEEALAGGRRANRTSDGPFRYGFLGRYFLDAVAPPPRRKLQAARRYRPAAEHSAAVLAANFARVQDSLLQVVEQSQGLDLARIRARSPAVWLLVLPVGIWFASLAAHEARHLLQARSVHAAAGFPARG